MIVEEVLEEKKNGMMEYDLLIKLWWMLLLLCPLSSFFRMHAGLCRICQMVIMPESRYGYYHLLSLLLLPFTSSSSMPHIMYLSSRPLLLLLVVVVVVVVTIPTIQYRLSWTRV